MKKRLLFTILGVLFVAIATYLYTGSAAAGISLAAFAPALGYATISYPFGDMDIQTKAYAAAIELTIYNQKTEVTIAQMTGAVALTALASKDLRAGAELIVISESDGTARDITPGTGFTSAVIAGTISKKKCSTFYYNGTTFVNQSTVTVN